jgi:hypothetical protein
MLRDDAIREGKITPTKDDIKRMQLTDTEVFDLAELSDKVDAQKVAAGPAVKVPPALAEQLQKDAKGDDKKSGK